MKTIEEYERLAKKDAENLMGAVQCLKTLMQEIYLSGRQNDANHGLIAFEEDCYKQAEAFLSAFSPNWKAQAVQLLRKSGAA